MDVGSNICTSNALALGEGAVVDRVDGEEAPAGQNEVLPVDGLGEYPWDVAINSTRDLAVVVPAKRSTHKRNMKCHKRKKSIGRQQRGRRQKQSLTFVLARAANPDLSLNAQQVQHAVAAAHPSYRTSRPETLRACKRKLSLAYREIKILKGDLGSLQIKYDRRGNRSINLEGDKKDITVQI